MRNMAAILESHRARAAQFPAAFLDDRTWNDLLLDEVFAVIDRTTSTLGQHALYHRLRRAPAPAAPDAFESLTHHLSEDAAARSRAARALRPLQDAHGYNLWWLAGGDVSTPAPWKFMFPFLSAALIVAIPGGLWLHAWGLVVACMAAAWSINFATLRSNDADADALRQIAPLVRAAVSLGFLDAEGTHSLLAPLCEAPRLRGLAAIARWASRNPLLTSPDGNFWEGIVNDVFNTVYEYLNLFFLVDRTAVFFGRRHLHTHARTIVGMVEAMGEVDAALSVAGLRADRRAWTRPAPFGGGRVRLHGVTHPLLESAVPNSIDLHPPDGVLVTGSNMSGKSTFLRTIGATVVMAQSLNTCFADFYEAPMFDIQSVIGRADDLPAGKSYYLVEVEALLALVSAAETGAPHLFLLDELFRGTNAVERIAAGESVLRALVDPHGRHVAIAATHDAELVELLDGCYAPFHFGDAVGPNGLEFSYRLTEGVATTRNAITLLRLQGAPASVVNRALDTAASLDAARARSLKPEA
ncbi:MAG TPA: hypothetical protein VHZ73_13210 [Vicinamibacterales bacterium]|jgi:hypothetical protein|nr:hypothetical protein [Vicinamibacterales bacterium]